MPPTLYGLEGPGAEEGSGRSPERLAQRITSESLCGTGSTG